MRIRTEAKRETIIEVASEVFLEAGFEGATMTQIAARVGGSKRTLYGYFSNKEELFIAVALSSAEGLLAPLFESLATTDEDLPTTLTRFGFGLIELVTREHTLQIHRTMIGVSGRTDIGRMFFATGPAKGQEMLSKYLAQQMDVGAIKRRDPTIAAQHFTALLQAETLLPGLLGALNTPTKEFLWETTIRAVQAFLDAYCTDPASVHAPAL